MEGGGKVDRDDLVPPFQREVLDGGNELHPRIVDKNVHRAEARLGLVDHVGDLGGLGHVGR